MALDIALPEWKLAPSYGRPMTTSGLRRLAQKSALNDALIGMIMGFPHCVWLGLRMAKVGWQHGHGQCPIVRPNLRRRSGRNIRMAVL